MNPTGSADISALVTVTDSTVEHLAELRARLAVKAEEAGMVDVAYRTIDTPVGTLLVAATDQGLVRVAYEREDFDSVLGVLAAKISPRVLHAPARLDETARQIEQYFAGTRHVFDVRLDHRLSSGFRQTVQSLLPRIDYGQTLTYKQVAELAGNPKAVRAVGTACAANPLPIVVPCHRVLRTDGGLGGYVGGLDAKTTLLALEKEAA